MEQHATAPAPAPTLILKNARVYTFTWSEPGRDGAPAQDAPQRDDAWRPDAEAIAIRDGEIVETGSNEQIAGLAGPGTKTLDLAGATVLPGFVDSHAHVVTHGIQLAKVNLVGVDSEEEMIERIAARAARTPKGEWIEAWGFDEGAWADRYPDNAALSARIPDHPVHAKGLHGFATWSNDLALEKAGITARTPQPVGGEIVIKDGEPTGVLLNNASELLFSKVIPPLSPAQLQEAVHKGLTDLASQGYTGIHEAGCDRACLGAFEALDAGPGLPIRVYVMLQATDAALLNEWIERGPRPSADGMLEVRAVKAYYDASLGARGARLLEDYSDRPGHRGVSGENYGFDRELVTRAMAAGFQVGIHAIGDAGNRESLDFIEGVYAEHPAARRNRNRIEHAQIVHPDDQPRFAALEVIASMEPPHMAEDMAWAEDRLGRARAAHGYAWRSLRRQGARLAFNSDLPGSDPNLFYGLHSAITRKSRAGEPAGGWFPEQAMTTEEAIRGYTTWNAYAGFAEARGGALSPGRRADLTVIDLDPFAVAREDPGALLKGSVVMTIAAGRVVHER